MSTTIKVANGDWVINTMGSVVDVYGAEKAAQDIGEGLLNNYDSEDPPYFTGSELWKLDGMHNVIIDDAEGTIEAMVSEALDRLMDRQLDDPLIDDEELIAEIRELVVWQAGGYSWAFYVLCVNNSEEELVYGFDIELLSQLPDSVAPTGNLYPGSDRSYL